MNHDKAGPRPEWLKVRYRDSEEFRQVAELTKRLNLNTVCQEARCPNLHECWGREKTATFMIMGEICTRRCMFCNVQKGKPGTLDPEEPEHVAQAVATLGLRHAVITQVNRDDLPDGGAQHFARTIESIRAHSPGCRVEVLISDLNGNWDALETILDARPEVLSHNTECVPRLYQRVRPFATYERTLELLARSARARGDRIRATKSGIMAGLGESLEEIFALMRDLRRAEVDFFTVGQYLQPSARHLPVERFVTPEDFRAIEEYAGEVGFVYTEAGPLVRSSYHAGRAAEALERHGVAAAASRAAPLTPGIG
ncbi:MAG: lipoyl synthase [Planctomycetota bacterium]